MSRRRLGEDAGQRRGKTSCHDLHPNPEEAVVVVVGWSLLDFNDTTSSVGGELTVRVVGTIGSVMLVSLWWGREGRLS